MLNAYSQLRQNNIILVASAGNSGVSLPYSGLSHYPSGYELDNVISVAATNSDDELSSVSNYGSDEVDVAAPGELILSTTFDGDYDYKSGTSMAAPAVTGLVSLIWSNNPDLSYQEVVNIVETTVDPIAGLDVSSGGRINVLRALDQIAGLSSLSSISDFSEETDGDPVRGTTYQQAESPGITAGRPLDPNTLIDNRMFVGILNPGISNAFSKLEDKISNSDGIFSRMTNATQYENLPGFVSFELSATVSKSEKIDIASLLTNTSVFDFAQPDYLYHLV